MRFLTVFLLLAMLTVSGGAQQRPNPTSAATGPGRTSITLFDNLKDGEDYIYLLSNSSFVWGPDPNSLSEEITFTGVVTVPKWPMEGFERRTLPDQRQQIDIELSASELQGQSYLLGGIVYLGESPDLKSMGTITSPAVGAAASPAPATQTRGNAPAPPPVQMFKVAADTAEVIQNFPQVLWSQLAADDAQRMLQIEPKKLRSIVGKQKPQEVREVPIAIPKEVMERMKLAEVDGDALMGRILSDLVTDMRKEGMLDKNMPAQLVVPHDFIVARKVLLTTAKGVLYNEAPVPVRGKLDTIPPIHRLDNAANVNVFHGMELPIPLLDKDKNIDGWFYSKSHVAMPVRPNGIEKETITAELKVKYGEREETVRLEGPAEIHHGMTHTYPDGRKETEIEVVILGLRGTSDALGGNIMVIESFSDKERFSRGRVAWENGKTTPSPLDLYVEILTPSGKLHNVNPITVMTSLDRFKDDGIVGRGRMYIPKLSAAGAKPMKSLGPQALYNDADRAVAEVLDLRLQIVDTPKIGTQAAGR